MFHKAKTTRSFNPKYLVGDRVNVLSCSPSSSGGLKASVSEGTIKQIIGVFNENIPKYSLVLSSGEIFECTEFGIIGKVEEPKFDLTTLKNGDFSTTEVTPDRLKSQDWKDVISLERIK